MASLSSDERKELDKLEFLTIEGVDQQRRTIIRVIGKFFPAAVFSREKLHSYILKKLESAVDRTSGFVVVYFHTEVESGVNNPGLLNLRWLYEMLPVESKRLLKAIYFVHPALQSRLALATLGRLFLTERFYSKLKYVDRIEFLWEFIESEQIQVPDFAWEHDDHLEHRPFMDYGFDSDDIQSMPYVLHPYCASC